MVDSSRSTQQQTAQHTPGPWTVDAESPANDGSVLARVGGGPNYLGLAISAPVFLGEADGRTEDRANARLIAAAPELLAAAYRGIAALTANGAPNCEAVKELRAAIASATGEGQ